MSRVGLTLATTLVLTLGAEMGKNEFLTPKAVRLHGTTSSQFSATLLIFRLCSCLLLCVLQIGNRIKAKGLQKLRWYCQMCQKQCRDENGFKCHQNSESHKRQMEVFGQNPGMQQQDAANLALPCPALQNMVQCPEQREAQPLSILQLFCLQQNVQQSLRSAQACLRSLDSNTSAQQSWLCWAVTVGISCSALGAGPPQF